MITTKASFIPVDTAEGGVWVNVTHITLFTKGDNSTIHYGVGYYTKTENTDKELIAQMQQLPKGARK